MGDDLRREHKPFLFSGESHMAGTVGVAPGTTTITLENGQTIQISDWIDDKLYSTVQFTNGQTTPIEAFSAGRSQQIPGGVRTSTRVDTNIPRAGSAGLPKDWEMYVYSVGNKMTRVMRAPTNNPSNPTLADTGGALSDPPTLRTLFNVDRVTYLEYIYNGKVYTQGVIQNYPQGHGFSVFSTNAFFELAQNGPPSPRDRNAMVLPIWMRENLGYTFAFQPEAALVIEQDASDAGPDLTFADLKTEFSGLIRRSVV
jgi:hypothetical protein